MPAHLVPSDPNNGIPANYQPGGVAWGQPAPMPPQANGLSEQIGRIVSALRRYKWLILAILAVGSSAGFALTRLVSPKYTVGGSIMIRKSLGNSGPITAPGVISDPNSWVDLVRSFMVLDGVVQKLGLFVQTANPADSTLVNDLKPTALLRPGAYELCGGRLNWSWRRLPMAARTGPIPAQPDR